MSILIKGIDMPKENQICKIELHPDGHCAVMKIEEGDCYSLEFNSETKAIQIPTPHGRIIDADLFKEIIKDSVPAWTTGVKIPTYGDMDIMDKIYFMPTILEAEE